MEIVSQVESSLSVTEESEAAVATNLKRAERLRQSILKKAFSGRLLELYPRDKSVLISTSLLEGTH
jgi:type I restriction enzyme S subunit